MCLIIKSSNECVVFVLAIGFDEQLRKFAQVVCEFLIYNMIDFMFRGERSKIEK